MNDKHTLIDAGADEILYFVEWMDRSVALDLAERVFDVWDQAYGAFETYDDYSNAQLDLFDQQGDLYEESLRAV